jgi:hypothetical protein
VKEVLGVDIGGVIIDPVNDGMDTSFFGDNFLRTTAVPGAFEVLRKLSERFSRIVLVSKCKERTQEKTLQWLAHHDFYALTGIEVDNVHFCRERYEKSGICERQEVTHFVDDRLEVLSYLTSVNHLYLFRPRAEEVKRFSHFLPRVKQVNSWQALLKELVP